MTERASEATRQWRILIVGCGSIGRRHISNLLALGQRQLSLVDADGQTLRRACEEFHLPGVHTLDEGLAWSPDAVMVATPTADHLRVALAAARCGAHLFIEKPLADTLEGAEELIRLVNERGLVTLVGCNMRFHPGPQLVRQVLADGRLGHPLGARLEVGSFLPSWRPDIDYRTSYSARKDRGGGCVLDGIHELDIACWLFGFPHEVFAVVRQGTSLQIETEELAEIILRYPSELVVSVHLDYVQQWRQRRYEVIASRGTVVWEHRRHEVMMFQGETGGPIRLGYESTYDVNQMYREELQHFLRCLNGVEQPVADIRWAAQVSRVALAVKQSAQTHQALSLLGEPSLVNAP